MTKKEIQKILPYGDNFLFLDEVLEIKENEISAKKKTSFDDFWVKSHFLNFPIMPGCLIVEGMAQTGTVLLRKKLNLSRDEDLVLAYFIKGAKFEKPVFPGDEILYKVKLLGIYGPISRFVGETFVKDERKCIARWECFTIKKEEFLKKYQK